MIIIAYIIIGMIVAASCVLIGLDDVDSKKARESVKTYYRHWRNWVDTFVAVLLWPVGIWCLIRYKLDF